MSNLQSRMTEYKIMVEAYLDKILDRQNTMQQVVFDAMKYSTEAGGKRIRPVLLLEFCRISGGDVRDALPFACALEMIHTYSLIHDDLPCMDNDDMRRGKPSCHKAFGEANALLAGDALLNLAFETMLSPQNAVGAQKALKAAHYISKCSGADGMIGGQIIDLSNEGKDISEETLLRLYKDKTAALLRAAAVAGCIIGGADDEKIKAAEAYAENLGLAFQIVDDILDATSTEEVLGKPIGSDEKNNKKTYISFHGIEKSKLQAQALTDNAISALSCFEDTEFLIELSNKLCKRDN